MHGVRYFVTMILVAMYKCLLHDTITPMWIAVDCLEARSHHHRYAKPISVARKVLEEPKVNMLVGNAAMDFAKKHGFTMEDNDALLTEDSRKAYQVSGFRMVCVYSHPFQQAYIADPRPVAVLE